MHAKCSFFALLLPLLALKSPASAQEPIAAQSPTTTTTSTTPPASSTESPAPVPSAASPVVLPKAGDWAFIFRFSGLAPLSIGGLADHPATPALLFTEFGMRRVFKHFTIPFAAGLLVANNTTRADPSVSANDFGIAATVGITVPFRVWRRIVPYAGGIFGFGYIDPSGPNNWQVSLGLGPLLGVEYFIADRVGIFGQGQAFFGINVTDAAVSVLWNTAISLGGSTGLEFYF